MERAGRTSARTDKTEVALSGELCCCCWVTGLSARVNAISACPFVLSDNQAIHDNNRLIGLKGAEGWSDSCAHICCIPSAGYLTSAPTVPGRDRRLPACRAVSGNTRRSPPCHRVLVTKSAIDIMAVNE